MASGRPFGTLGRVLLGIGLMLVDIAWYLGMLVDIWIEAGMNVVRRLGALAGMAWHFVVVDMGYHFWIMLDKV